MKKSVGIITPISGNDTHDGHYFEVVNELIKDALSKDIFDSPSIVSASSYLNTFQTNIIQNIANNDLVIVNITDDNPNVMIELGLRLGFDKPIIIIRDNNSSDAPSDIKPLQYLAYTDPTNVDYSIINEFKTTLNTNAIELIEKYEANPHFSQFLGNFKITNVAQVDNNNFENINDALEDISSKLNDIHSSLLPEKLTAPVIDNVQTDATSVTITAH